MKKIALTFMAAGSLFLASCSITLPVTATSNSYQQAQKEGESKATLLFNIPLKGDASISSAAKNGGIDKISTVDTKLSTFFGIINTVTTKVKGN